MGEKTISKRPEERRRPCKLQSFSHRRKTKAKYKVTMRPDHPKIPGRPKTVSIWPCATYGPPITVAGRISENRRLSKIINKYSFFLPNLFRPFRRFVTFCHLFGYVDQHGHTLSNRKNIEWGQQKSLRMLPSAYPKKHYSSYPTPQELLRRHLIPPSDTPDRESASAMDVEPLPMGSEQKKIINLQFILFCNTTLIKNNKYLNEVCLGGGRWSRVYKLATPSKKDNRFTNHTMANFVTPQSIIVSGPLFRKNQNQTTPRKSRRIRRFVKNIAFIPTSRWPLPT